MRKKPELMTTTLWDFPSQQYGDETQGSRHYEGATPAYILWNLLQRYTKKGDLVVDPMAGSGTTLDVARELERRALGYDLQPTRPDVFRHDARQLPLQDDKADFVFVDPPYSTHIRYSDDPRCIGRLDAREPAYYEAMEQVIREIHRVLRPNRYMALYVCDSFKKNKPFCPIGFELFAILRRYFEPVDIICVVRHNRKLEYAHWHRAAAEGNFFLRGFNYLFIMRKPPRRPEPRTKAAATAHSVSPAGPATRLASAEKRTRGIQHGHGALRADGTGRRPENDRRETGRSRRGRRSHMRGA